MADGAIGVFLVLAKDLISYNYNLLSGIKPDFDLIHDDIKGFEAFLQDAAGWRNSKSIQHLIAQMRDVAYEAEDAIETYVVLNYGKGFVDKLLESKKLRDVAQEFKVIKAKIKQIKEDKIHVMSTLHHLSDFRNFPSASTGIMDFAQGDEVVGLDKETKDLIKLLTSSWDERKVVAIAGMPGLGKTTLANKVFTHPDIEYKFMYRVWVRISQQYNKNDALREILRKFGDDSVVPDGDLGAELCKHLAEKHCLIVLDDIWTEEAWNELQHAFPTKNNHLRILVTTRWNRVATLAQEGDPFPLEFLDSDKSFQLLEKRVFRKQKCPGNLRELGQEVADKCCGLPLAIVIIAGILRHNHNDRWCWEDMSRKVPENVAKEDGCKVIVGLSYNNLPYHLRACFLYFGMFPQSYQIPVSTLIYLWISEGFINQVEGMDLEVQAEKYLQELVDRNLVLVEKTNCTKRIKVCRIHDILHDLCIQEARDEKILYQIKDFDHFRECSKQVNWNKHRRLSIHSRALEYLSSKASGEFVRSFLSLGPEVTLPIHEIRTFPGAFQLLRVLDVTSILLSRFPKLLIKLVHLRYVAIYIDFEILSPDMTKLSKLQVLVVRVKRGDVLVIAANIWEMYQLRHLQTNIPVYFDVPRKKIEQAAPSTVKTLTSISPKTCTAEFFAKIPKVKKLGIRGDLHELPRAKGEESGSIGFSRLHHLEILKIRNQSMGISYIPAKRTFPDTLRELTLSNTNLSWDTHMETIAMLCNLVVLKLKDNAFVGKSWKPTSEGFRNLEVFHLGRTDLENWDAKSDNFPSITTIALKYCESLKGIPSDLANVPNLQKLDIYCTNDRVASSGKEIQLQVQKKKPDCLFKLTVFPSVH